MKIIVLIIDSFDLDLYKDLRELWKLYMNLNPNIECYFLYGDENINDEVYEEKNILKVKVKDSLQPGIYDKTSLALQYCLEKYPETDYYIRTNISSFWNWEMLMYFLQNKP